jgi:hypothetical protein
MFNNKYFEHRTDYEIMWKKCSTAVLITDGNVAHVYCMMDTKGWRDIIRICVCNFYYFSTETMVARTRLNVTSYVQILSCYNLDGVCLLRGPN